jgi:gamma-glutamyltranspeptidase/glutathione hydrolase
VLAPSAALARAAARRARMSRRRFAPAAALLLLVVAGCQAPAKPPAHAILGSTTYRPEVVGRVGVVAAGRHFAAEAGLRMLARGGNAIDAGVAATFAAAVTEISHFGLGGEAPLIVYRADRGQVAVVNGQGTAPAAATLELFQRAGRIPASGPGAGTVPAVVDALCIALAEFGTVSLADALAPAVELADGFPWYDFLTLYLMPETEKLSPAAERFYLPGGEIPKTGAIFRQADLARTLRDLAAAEREHLAEGRAAAIYAARDRFYRGDIAARIAAAVQADRGLLTAADLAAYRGRVEAPTRATFTTRHGTFEVFKTGFWGQGPMLGEALQILQGFDLERMGHNSPAYIHTVVEALKLALADRDAFYGDPDFTTVPAAGLLSERYAADRRRLIDPERASTEARPGDPWKYQAGARVAPPAPLPAVATATDAPPARSPDTTSINVADARGNLFSAAPSSGWFFGGTYIAGDTGVPLGNRMQAFLLEPGHPNVVAGGKRPRTTLSPTIILRDGQPFAALSSPGGDSQDQQALQVFLAIAVFGMRPQQAIEAPRFNSLHHRESFRGHAFNANVLVIESRIPAETVEALRRLGHKVSVTGSFMVDTGTTFAGFDAGHGTVVGAADVRRQRFVTGW